MLNSVTSRKFGNCSKMDCRLRKGLTDLYNNNEKFNNPTFECPKDLGEGSFSKIISNKNLEICKACIKCKKNIPISCRITGEAYMLRIFTGNGEKKEWLEKNSNFYSTMREGQAILYKIKDTWEHAEYRKNYNYDEVNIIMNPRIFDDHFSSDFLEKNIFNGDCEHFKRNKFYLPVETNLIIQQIIHCPYDCKIKDMYLEGKILELFSICLTNIMERNLKNNKSDNLSKTERESIYCAKKILDDTIHRQINISEISKLVHLNEHALKTGFKEIFGKPIYTYKLDKKMELARELLEIHSMAIDEVASRVGYANRNSFSKAFRKRYGISPGKYI